MPGTRDITTATETAAAASQVSLLLFVELDFSSGFVRCTNASFNVDWNGHTWTGVGSLGAVDQAREVLDVEAIGLSFTLTGVDPAKIATALAEFYQGRAARLWVGFIDSGAIVADPVLLFVGRMDTMTIEHGTQAKITVAAESRLASWSRVRTRRFSDADQQLEFPGDLGLQEVDEFASGKQVVWGRS